MSLLIVARKILDMLWLHLSMMSEVCATVAVDETPPCVFVRRVLACSPIGI